MLYAVLADIHGNLEALHAVLDEVERSGADRLICLGDLVGYGADPSECVDAMRHLDAIVVAGNHDWAAVEKLSTAYFNADARDSINWTRTRLSADQMEYLASLELMHMAGGVTAVHSSPSFPEYFDYLQTVYDVRLAFDHVRTDVCFVGHSHVPIMFLDTMPINYFLRSEFEIPVGHRAIVNVGSVGQPRDLDPRACYVLYDSDERVVRMYRLDYDVHAASEKMMACGLPATNAARIMVGR
ncbi:MAG: metallophosphoesterase family protein [Candidatus Brocadiae bacterium]|nr:metallophosphoesterase family protein [Candidatus Brocadiia bacterium]